jgi:hypothetical protein
VITPDGKKLYAIERQGTAVSVVRVSDLRLLGTLRLPATAYSTAMSTDGRWIFVGTAAGIDALSFLVVSVERSANLLILKTCEYTPV